MHLSPSTSLAAGSLLVRTNVGYLAAKAMKMVLVLIVAGSIGMCGALRAGVAPAFDRQITISAGHYLAIHNGPNGRSCAGTGVPAQVDCAWRVPGQRAFYVRYITPQGSWLLISFPVPGH